MFKKRGLPVFLVLLLAASTVPKALGNDVMTLQVDAGDYRIVERHDGQVIEMDGFGYLMIPGKPMLPARNFLIALPPDASVQSVEIEGVNPQQLPEWFNIIPTPPVLPMVNTSQYHQRIEQLHQEWRESYQATYSSDAAYPEERGKIRGSGTLRKYSYVSVSFYPFSYHANSGRLTFYPSAQISISYHSPSLGTDEALRAEEMKRDMLADAKASRLFMNYDQIHELYQPAGSPKNIGTQNYNYVIITSNALEGAIIASNFLDWKASLGYEVETMLITDTQISGQSGSDLAEKIRNFLRNYYVPWGIEYVLLVGDYATIPMRYCYPDSSNHLNGAGNPASWPWSGDVPTDYYYADLSYPDADSWDSDGDGYCGEYEQDSPDFLAEVSVGRIPTSDPDRITYTLNKLVAFEQDTGTWKHSALGAGAIAYFANEDHSGRDLNDGAFWIDTIETDLMSGWTTSHYSEQAGLAVSEYDWPALSQGAFTSDWRNGQYGVVNWDAHGWSNRAARKVWSWDDGDGVPESSDPDEMAWYDMISTSSYLDDDHPSILYAVSCMVGYPEPNDWGNLGIDLLTRPSYGSSAGIISGSRVVWVSLGGGDLLCYHFNRFLIDGPDGPEKVGDALYDSEFFHIQNYTWEHYSEYWDLFTYNLYGDPSLVREGVFVPLCGDCNSDGIINLSDPIYLLNYLYKGGTAPDPLEIGDCNCNQIVDLEDAVYLLNYLFKQGPSPCET